MLANGIIIIEISESFQFCVNITINSPNKVRVSLNRVNMALLKKLKLINKNSQKLKILGTGEIKDKVNIEADLISKSAVEKLEKIGGSIQLKK